MTDDRAAKKAAAHAASEKLLVLEDRKLHYLNRHASANSAEERKAIDKEFKDVIEWMTSETSTLAKPKSPKPTATAETSIAAIIELHGAMAVAMAAIEAATDAEVEEVIGVAVRLHASRNPDATLADIAALTGGEPAAPTKADGAGETYLAEEAGAYAQPDETVVKFATGDTLHVTDEGFMTVTPSIPDDWASKKWQERGKLAKALGGDVKTKEDIDAFLQLKAEERTAAIAAVAEPE